MDPREVMGVNTPSSGAMCLFIMYYPIEFMINRCIGQILIAPNPFLDDFGIGHLLTTRPVRLEAVRSAPTSEWIEVLEDGLLVDAALVK